MALFDQVALEDNKVDLTKLHIYLPSIATEGMFESLVDRFKATFTAIKDVFMSKHLDNSIKDDEALKILLLKIDEDLNKLNKYPTQNEMPNILHKLGTTPIPVPNGFNGDLKHLVAELIGLSNSIYKIHSTEINVLNTTLSVYISNKGNRKSANDFSKEIAAAQRANASVQDNINQFFTYTSKNPGMLLLKDIINSYRELLGLHNDIEKLVKLNEFKQILTVQAEVNKSVELIDMFIAEINKSEQDIDVNYIKNITLFTNEMAKLTESLSMVRYYSELVIKLYSNIVSKVAGSI